MWADLVNRQRAIPNSHSELVW